MYVYRIEHEKFKIGPYCCGALNSISKGWFRYWLADKCPDPRQDGLGEMSYSEFSGFASKKHLCNWFRLRDIFKLRKRGFRVYKFKVDKKLVRKGSKQVCFVRYAAKDQQEIALRVLAWHRAKSMVLG